MTVEGVGIMTMASRQGSSSSSSSSQAPPPRYFGPASAPRVILLSLQAIYLLKSQYFSRTQRRSLLTRGTASQKFPSARREGEQEA